MSEVRSCVYFLVICLCVQISVAKPFFGPWFWCDLLCEEDDGFTTTASYEDYYDAYCNDCPTRRPTTSTTRMPPANLPPGVPNPGAPGMPPMGAPGQPPVIMMSPNQGGMSVNMVPDPNRVNGWTFNFAPWNPAGQSGPPMATPAPVPMPPAGPAAAGTNSEPLTVPAPPAVAVTTAAPITTVAPATTAAPAAAGAAPAAPAPAADAPPAAPAAPPARK